MLEVHDLALLQGAPAPRSSEFFRQTNDFFYLSGVEVPHAYLLLDAKSRSTTLYLPHHDSALERSEGRRLSADNAAEAHALTGIEVVEPLESTSVGPAAACTQTFLPALLHPVATGQRSAGYADQLLRAAAMAASDPWNACPTSEASFVQLLMQRFPQIALADLSPLLDRMRLVKSDAELHLLRIAGRLSAQAVIEAMRCTRPGMMEFELAAIADLVFTAGGERGESYRAIIATGDNAWFGHYGRLGAELRRGDLVLMDYAPDVAYYRATWADVAG